jgi:hypothetical protein
LVFCLGTVWALENRFIIIPSLCLTLARSISGKWTKSPFLAHLNWLAVL